MYKLGSRNLSKRLIAIQPDSARYSTSPMTSAAFGERVDELISLAAARMNSDLVPGLQIGVIDGDSESVTSLGVTDVRSRRAVSDDTLFRIGSITKTFTATVLVQLAQEGRLRL